MWQETEARGKGTVVTKHTQFTSVQSKVNYLICQVNCLIVDTCITEHKYYYLTLLQSTEPCL